MDHPVLFLLTPLREGRQIAFRARSGTDRYFYSRPCGRGDEVGRCGNAVCFNISTHAPAGGATELHRSTRAARAYFYSRPCGRGDETEMVEKSKIIVISTHAPAGGATYFIVEQQRPSNGRISTHAPAGGATLPSSSSTLVRSVFLLTPLREGRLLGRESARRA